MGVRFPPEVPNTMSQRLNAATANTVAKKAVLGIMANRVYNEILQAANNGDTRISIRLKKASTNILDLLKDDGYKAYYTVEQSDDNDVPVILHIDWSNAG